LQVTAYPKTQVGYSQCTSFAVATSKIAQTCVLETVTIASFWIHSNHNYKDIAGAKNDYITEAE